MLAKVTLATLSMSAIGLIAVLFSLPVPDTEAGAVSGLVFRGVRVFDGESLHEDMTVIVRDTRILGVSSNAEIPEGMRVIDGRGRTLLPGFIDAHVHTWGRAQQDALRFGVTTMLDMFTAPAELAREQAERDDTRADKADLYSAGMLATVDGGHGTQFGIAVATLDVPAEAGDWVARRLAEGSDWIKLVYDPYSDLLPGLDLATARAVIGAAHARGLQVVAHVSTQAAARDMVEAGIDGLVHGFSDTVIEPALAAAMAAGNVFVIPTLVVSAAAAGDTPGQTLMEDDRLAQWLDAGQRQTLQAGFGPWLTNFDKARAQANTLALNAAGVDILAGSDAPNPGTAHGVSLHQELALLVEAGLSPQSALRAATSLPADRFSLQDRGRIVEGARADLVLVNGNPGVDITASRDIVMIIRNGKPVERERRDRPPLSGTPAPRLLGDFESTGTASNGYRWTVTSDTAAGGRSDATLARVPGGPGSSTTALRVDARINSGHAYPWAGAFVGTLDNAGANLAPYAAIAFDIRGTPGAYRAMMFNPGFAGVPPMHNVEVTAQWQRVTLPLAAFRGFDPEAFAGMAIVPGDSIGEFTYYIDNVGFE